jgi:hypothetical protein
VAYTVPNELVSRPNVDASLNVIVNQIPEVNTSGSWGIGATADVIDGTGTTNLLIGRGLSTNLKLNCSGGTNKLLNAVGNQIPGAKSSSGTGNGSVSHGLTGTPSFVGISDAGGTPAAIGAGTIGATTYTENGSANAFKAMAFLE